MKKSWVAAAPDQHLSVELGFKQLAPGVWTGLAQLGMDSGDRCLEILGAQEIETEGRVESESYSNDKASGVPKRKPHDVNKKIVINEKSKPQMTKQ